MKDAYIFYSVIEIFLMKQKNQDRKKRGPFGLLKLQNGIGTIMEEHISLFVKTSKYLDY